MSKTALVAPDSGTLTQQAYALLRRDILAGTLEPGSKLRIEALKTRYGIGPTPLREALSRLDADGFVFSEENRGFRIPLLSLDDLRDVTDQRKMVECMALRRSIARMDADYEGRVLAAYHKLSLIDANLGASGGGLLAEWEEHHRAYHQALNAGARSRWLTKFQAILYDQADRYRRLYLPRTRPPLQVSIDHREILEATLARDADRACDLLADHIERVFEIASKSPIFTEAREH